MPIITISRLFGSGGSEVAQIVAHELGWDLLDNAVVDAVADRTGLSPAEVAEREERLPSMAERIIEALMMGTEEIMSPIASAKLPPSDERLLEVTRKILDEAAARGSVVIVGRGAQEMLGSRDDIMSVFCYASMEHLVRQWMKREQLSEEDAIKKVEETNKRRSEWVKAHWGRDWTYPGNYDLCVNTGTYGIAGSADIIQRVAKKWLEENSQLTPT